MSVRQANFSSPYECPCLARALRETNQRDLGHFLDTYQDPCNLLVGTHSTKLYVCGFINHASFKVNAISDACGALYRKYLPYLNEFARKVKQGSWNQGEETLNLQILLDCWAAPQLSDGLGLYNNSTIALKMKELEKKNEEVMAYLFHRFSPQGEFESSVNPTQIWLKMNRHLGVAWKVERTVHYIPIWDLVVYFTEFDSNAKKSFQKLSTEFPFTGREHVLITRSLLKLTPEEEADLGICKGKELETSLRISLSLRKFFIIFTLKSLATFNLTMPRKAFTLLRELLEKHPSERTRISVNIFFEDVDAKLAPQINGENLKQRWQESRDLLKTYFKDPAEKPFKDLLETALLFSFCKSHLMDLKYAVDVSENWENYLFDCLSLSSEEERRKIFRKLLELDLAPLRNPAPPEGIIQFKERDRRGDFTFASLTMQNYLKPYQAVLLWLQQLYLESHPSFYPAEEFLQWKEKEVLLNKIDAFLGVKVSTEIAFVFCMGFPIRKSFKEWVEQLAELRGQIDSDEPPFLSEAPALSYPLLQNTLQTLFVNEEKELRFQIERNEIAGTLLNLAFFNPDLRHVFAQCPLIIPNMTGKGLLIFPPGGWVPLSIPIHLSDKFGKGVHCLCQWRLFEGVMNLEITLIVSWKLLKIRTLRVPLKIPQQAFIQNPQLLELYRAFAEIFRKDGLTKQERAKPADKKDAIYECLYHINHPFGPVAMTAYDNFKGPELTDEKRDQLDKLYGFFKQVLRTCRTMPSYFVEGEKDKGYLETETPQTLASYGNLDLLENEEGLTVLPLEHALAKNKDYTLTKENYHDTIENIYALCKKQTSPIEFDLKVAGHLHSRTIGCEACVAIQSQRAVVTLATQLSEEEILEESCGFPLDGDPFVARQMIFMLLGLFKSRLYLNR